MRRLLLILAVVLVAVPASLDVTYKKGWPPADPDRGFTDLLWPVNAAVDSDGDGLADTVTGQCDYDGDSSIDVDDWWAAADDVYAASQAGKQTWFYLRPCGIYGPPSSTTLTAYFVIPHGMNVYAEGVVAEGHNLATMQAKTTNTYFVTTEATVQFTDRTSGGSGSWSGSMEWVGVGIGWPWGSSYDGGASGANFPSNKNIFGFYIDQDNFKLSGASIPDEYSTLHTGFYMRNGDNMIAEFLYGGIGCASGRDSNGSPYQASCQYFFAGEDDVVDPILRKSVFRGGSDSGFHTRGQSGFVVTGLLIEDVEVYGANVASGALLSSIDGGTLRRLNLHDLSEHGLNHAYVGGSADLLCSEASRSDNANCNVLYEDITIDATTLEGFNLAGGSENPTLRRVSISNAQQECLQIQGPYDGIVVEDLDIDECGESASNIPSIQLLAGGSGQTEGSMLFDGGTCANPANDDRYLCFNVNTNNEPDLLTVQNMTFDRITTSGQPTMRVLATTMDAGSITMSGNTQPSGGDEITQSGDVLSLLSGTSEVDMTGAPAECTDADVDGLCDVGDKPVCQVGLLYHDTAAAQDYECQELGGGGDMVAL